MNPGTSKARILCAFYVVAHIVAHLLAQWFEVTPGISIWYPPGGLALALLVTLGPRYLPVVFLANLATAWMPPPASSWMLVFFPVLITLGYGGAAMLVRRYLRGRLMPGGFRNTLGFYLVVALAPLFVALTGSAVYHLIALAGHERQGVDFWTSVVSWWIGDASGILTVMPVVMVFVAPWLDGTRGAAAWTRMKTADTLITLAQVALLAGSILLVLTVPVLRDRDAFYLCFLPLIWICMRHGLPGATLATLLVMLVGLVSMRLVRTTTDFAYVFLLFELAVSSVGLGLGTLVSRRREAELQLAMSRARLDRVMTGAQLGYWDLDVKTERVDFNERFTTMIGYSFEDVSSQRGFWQSLVHPADSARLEGALQDHLDGYIPLFEAEFRLRSKEGHWRWLHSRGSIVLRDQAGKPWRVSGTQVDITDRKRAEAEAGRLRRIIETTPDLVFMTDAAGNVLYANAALLAACGRTALPEAGVTVARMLSGGAGERLLAEALPAALKTGRWQGEGSIVDVAGRVIPTSQIVLAHRDEETEAFVFSVNMRDLSDRQRAESERRRRDRELLQLQKAESLSVLAGGIAHDFNNLLTSMMCNASLLGMELPAGSGGHALVEKIDLAAKRAAELCQQMLAYAGRNPVAFAETDLNRLIVETRDLFAASIDPRIEVRLLLADTLPRILAAGAQMQQVVMNLVLNAAEAIGPAEGQIIVRTDARHLDAAALGRQFPGHTAVPGKFVVLEVEDTGGGMTEETKARIFEPFFTTKFTGKGLGLAAVAGVVKSHRGAVGVRSVLDEGTLFRVAFPAVPAVQTEPAPPSVVAPDAWRGSGTVLVVDDDVLVGETTALILEKTGLRVLVADSGASGVELFTKHAGELSAVLLDLTMRGMDGFEAHARMHRVAPGVPVILMSGFSEKLDRLPPEAIHPAAVLAKPFSSSQLRTRLRGIIEKRR